MLSSWSETPTGHGFPNRSVLPKVRHAVHTGSTPSFPLHDGKGQPRRHSDPKFVPGTTPDAGEFGSFTILTGPSAGWLGDYHTRAPMILEAHVWRDWLDVSRDPAQIIAAVRPERFETSLPG